MLYKGKGKRTDKVGSYRKISIGMLVQKIIDVYITNYTNIIAKQSQPSTQYGFTKDVNYLQCTVIREALQTVCEEKKISVICLTSDISNVFSRTDRISQLYECLKGGEHGKYFRYTAQTYKGTSTVIYGDKQFFNNSF